MDKEENKSSISDSILKRFSEKLYLAFIALIFFALAIIIGIDIWYLPIFGLERDLAINLFTDSIIAGLTIVFLNIFLILRKEREWRIVKDEVCFFIRMDLSLLFDEIIEMTDDGLNFKASMISEINKGNRKKMLIEKMKKLENGTVKLNNFTVSLLFKNNDSLEGLTGISKRLSNLEMKYSRYLSSEVIFCLMRLQMGIESLEYYKRLNCIIEEMRDNSHKPILPEFESLISDSIKKITLPYVTGFIKAMVSYIYKLYSLGFEFDYPNTN